MTDATPFHERLDWNTEAGEIRDGEVRYLFIRPDTLMGLFLTLPPEARGAALEALGRSTAEHGRKSAERYQRLGASEAAQLIATIEGTAPQIGWGVWRLSRSDDGGFALEVRNSPFAAGYGASQTPVCTPIVGMFIAVSSLIAGCETSGHETECVAAGAASCRFRATLVS